MERRLRNADMQTSNQPNWVRVTAPPLCDVGVNHLLL